MRQPHLMVMSLIFTRKCDVRNLIAQVGLANTTNLETEGLTIDLVKLHGSDVI